MSNELNIDQNDKDIELEKLYTDSVELIHYARNVIVKHVNIVQIMTYYSLGRWIVETQQMGQKRAKYGSKVIKILSEKLQEEFGKGFSEDTLKNARKFYLTYKERISETVFSLFAIEKSETVFSLFEKEPPFIVSWSHYLQLMRIENEDERSFYEIESAKSGWAVRTLQRQYNSSLYERLALSRDKNGVLRLAKEGNVIEKPEDIIKQPTVLEFLGMEEKAKYSETDLETALINKLQKFLLELGKGYLFEARQKRFTYDEENFYVDLVFYNRLLRCYVLIDLKVDKLTHILNLISSIKDYQLYCNSIQYRHLNIIDEGKEQYGLYDKKTFFLKPGNNVGEIKGSVFFNKNTIICQNMNCNIVLDKRWTVKDDANFKVQNIVLDNGTEQTAVVMKIATYAEEYRRYLATYIHGILEAVNGLIEYCELEMVHIGNGEKETGIITLILQ